MSQQSAPVGAARPMPVFPEFVAMMASLMALTALSIDIMLPALPQIDHTFQIAGANDQQLVVTMYVLGFAAGQIFYGPLSDRYGRRRILLFGLCLYAFASLLCLAAGSFAILLAARVLQGIANAASMVEAIELAAQMARARRQRG